MKPARAEKLGSLEEELERILTAARDLEERYRAQLDQLHPDQTKSGLNLLHYLALRRGDVRELQDELGAFGLSSLGHSGAHVLATLHAVRHAVRALQGHADKRKKGPVTFKQGHKLLKEHTRTLFGRKTKGSAARIMVTLPIEAADDPKLVHDLLEAGMNCARINCAQGGPPEWERMLAYIERARRATGRACRTFMDVAGPKIRTGPLAPGPRVLAIRPKKDARGLVVAPEPVILAPDPPQGPRPGPPAVPIGSDLFRQLEAGDRLTFLDTRGKPGCLDVVSVDGGEAWATCPFTVYLESGLAVSVATGTGEERAHGHVGPLPSLDDPIVLRVGDTLVVHKDPRPGEPARPAGAGQPSAPAHVSCTLPDVLDDVRAGEAIVLDDGKARGVIREIGEGEVRVEITQAPPEGMRLRGSKGINLPDSTLRIPSLTAQDKEDLRFIAAHADGVNVSFVNHPDDVEDLLDELEAAGGRHLGLILKIETKHGFRQLPGILLAAMEWPQVGVMIARGDLAVEAGFTHLARVQEEILWVCEAAHVPVVWATEVLDRLAKKGMPTRSEISDVVMAERAECVMLNKGPYILEAIRTLDEVLRSMQAYQRKKTTLLPALTLDEPDEAEVGRAVGTRQGRWRGGGGGGRANARPGRPDSGGSTGGVDR
ncbi:MAG: pyruvate kinase [Longimicrobiales bacterium]|nr:pyruvate kinase [Longimicrobiales bacterium]